MTDKPPLNGAPLDGLTGSHIKPAATVDAERVPDDVLRRLNHADWLGQFAQVLNLKAPGSPPMTPMRQGAITRLELAAKYIRLLEKDLHWAKKGITDGDDAENRYKPEPDEFSGR